MKNLFLTPNLITQKRKRINRSESPDRSKSYSTIQTRKLAREHLDPTPDFNPCTFNIIPTKLFFLSNWTYDVANEICTVCQETVQLPCPDCHSTIKDCIPVQGYCSHYMHKHCIEKWITRKVLEKNKDKQAACPNCNQRWQQIEDELPLDEELDENDRKLKKVLDSFDENYRNPYLSFDDDDELE